MTCFHASYREVGINNVDPKFRQDPDSETNLNLRENKNVFICFHFVLGQKKDLYCGDKNIFIVLHIKNKCGIRLNIGGPFRSMLGHRACPLLVVQVHWVFRLITYIYYVNYRRCQQVDNEAVSSIKLLLKVEFSKLELPQ